MSTSKEIKGKIRGVKQTQKITRAMEMVAASKMRKAQERMDRARPYAEKIRQVIKHIARSNPEYKHPFMEERPVKRAAYIVITKHQPSKPEWQTGIDKLLEHPDNHRLITVREILKPDNRGGLVEGSGNERLRIFNAIPFITVPRCWTHTSGMVIGTDGTVAICTLDYHKQTNFGNIMTSSIEQIWDGQLKAARKMSRSGKPATDICVACLK